MSLRFRRFSSADIPVGMRLAAQNGWNQLEADWRRQLDLQPDGCVIAESAGLGIGTACACIFGNVAWIALVLVDADCRGQGVGTALMQHLLDDLDGRGISSIRLDATPLGRPVYEKLGFRGEYNLERWEGTLPSTCRQPAVINAERVTAVDLPSLCKLDRDVTSTDRDKLLRRLFQEQPEEMRMVRGSNGVAAFLAARPGARGWQVGPCLGRPAACRELLQHAFARHAGQTVILDIPTEQVDGRELAREFGLKVTRPLLRMGRGPTIREDVKKLWTTYGPEKG